MKKIILILTTILLTMCCTVLSGCDYDDGHAPDGMSFSLNEAGDGYVVSEYSANGSSVVIPKKYNGLPVIGISQYAFQDCTSLKSITLPTSMIYIGSGAFFNCSSLSEIKIPDSVTHIGERAFWCCSSLKRVSFEKNSSLTEIGDVAFIECTSLTEIKIPEGVTDIGWQAFDHCTSLESIELPGSVTFIDSIAFRGCAALTDIYFGGTVQQFENIEKGGAWCAGMPSFTIHCSDGDIDKVVAQGMSFSLNEAGDGYVVDCYYGDASEVTIPSEYNELPVVGISSFSFAFLPSRTSLESVRLPASITYIGEGALNVFSLTDIYFDGTVQQFVAIEKDNRWGLSIPYYTLHCSDGDFLLRNSQQTYHISSNDTGDGCLFGSYYNYGIAAEVTVLSEYANLPVVGISNAAFAGCTFVESIELPDSITYIGSLAFDCCLSLTDIYFDGTMQQFESIEKGDKWDAGISSYTVHCSDGDIYGHGTQGNAQRMSFLPNEAGDGYILDRYYGWASEVTIPLEHNGLPVVGISRSAFIGSIALTDIYFGGTMQQFENMEKGDKWDGIMPSYTVHCSDGDIEVEHVPGMSFSLNEAGDGYFLDDYYGVTSEITVPSEYNGLPVVGIYGYTFSSSSRLKTITLPGSVTFIGDSAFDGCTSLTDICFGGTVQQFEDMEKDDMWDAGMPSYTVHCSDGDISK